MAHGANTFFKLAKADKSTSLDLEVPRQLSTSKNEKNHR